jgi:hypothetical protein
MAIAAIWGSAPASADQQSYLAYLDSHHVNTPFGTPERNIALGLDICQKLHQGMTPDQVVGLSHSPLSITLTDIPGVLDAAQHELCPDTLH